MITVRSWFGVHWKLFRVLQSIVDRIEKLEAATFHGYPVVIIYVPEGMQVNAAWQLHQKGQTLGGKKTYILTDPRGNFLKVLN